MKILPNIQYNSTNYSPTFYGKKLVDVNLLLKTINKTQKNDIPANFIKLDNSDYSLIYELCDEWERTVYGDLICTNFLRRAQKKFSDPRFESFIVAKDKATSPDDIFSIAEIYKTSKNIDINFIQSISELKQGKNIKGAGTMMLYGIVEYAKKLKIQSISLTSDTLQTDAWYKKLGFINIGKSSNFYLPRKYFNKFLKNIEKKYFPRNFFIKNAKKN